MAALLPSSDSADAGVRLSSVSQCLVNAVEVRCIRILKLIYFLAEPEVFAYEFDKSHLAFQRHRGTHR